MDTNVTDTNRVEEKSILELIARSQKLLQLLLPPHDLHGPGLAPLWRGCDALIKGAISDIKVYAWVLRNLGNLLLKNFQRVVALGSSTLSTLPPEIQKIARNLPYDIQRLLQTSLIFEDDPEVSQQLMAVEVTFQQAGVLMKSTENVCDNNDTRVKIQASHWHEQGTKFHDKRDWINSKNAFEKALQINPKSKTSFFMWMYLRSQCADWGNIQSIQSKVQTLLKKKKKKEISSEAYDAVDNNTNATPKTTPLAGLLLLYGSQVNPLHGYSAHVNGEPLQANPLSTEFTADKSKTWSDHVQELGDMLHHYYSKNDVQQIVGHPWILENLPVSRDIQLKVSQYFALLMTRLAERQGVTEVTKQTPSLVGSPTSSNLAVARFQWALSHNKKPLRIGFVSADFRQKATLYLCVAPMCEMFKQTHTSAKNQVPNPVTGRHTELFVFATSLDFMQGSTWRQQLKITAGDHFVELGHLRQDPVAMARAIRCRDIDILIDMDGYSNEGIAVRTLFSTRLAPVTTSWFVYMGTTGQPHIDFIVADEEVLPSHVAKHHSERVLSLPSPFFPISHATLFADVLTLDSFESKNYWRNKYGLPRIGSHVVFACFNKHLKITPYVWACWVEILKAVPSSVLLLLENPIHSVPALKSQFKESGLAMDRLKFCPFVDTAEEHIFRVAMVDVILDTPPWGAHTGAADALWCATPLVTTAQPSLRSSANKSSFESMASRVAHSLLACVGATELIGRDLVEYTDIAIRLGIQEDWRGTIVAKLKAARKGPTFNAKRYARNFINGMHVMYASVCDAKISMQELPMNIPDRIRVTEI